jgi:saccharopine dehydrogenase-like NADP-dependent oxidoreductase
MKRVLVLGAGLVARPMVTYLLDRPDIELTVATRTVSKAEKMVGDHPRGKALTLNVEDKGELEGLVEGADLVVSLVPYAYHVSVAELCIKHKRQMVTTSYVSPEMKALDARAREAGIIVLNEIGLDPGIDHMSAMRIIHDVEKKGGKVVSFKSYCGALPAPEAANNPLGYRFSWSPRGVLMASRNPALYLKDGEEVSVPGEVLFDDVHTIYVEGVCELEAYPNRDSVAYVETYGLEGIPTMFRGTLRNRGWCHFWRKMADVHFLSDSARDDLAGMTYAGFTASLVPGAMPDNARTAVAGHLQIGEESEVIRALDWLGFLEDEPLPEGVSSNLDVVCERLLEKISLGPGERDMVVLQHEFLAELPGGNEKIYSTLVDYGIPDGDTAIARTVSLPAAVSAKLILDGTITLTGVHVPVMPEVYNPVLDELEQLEIVCKERSEKV